MAWGMQIAKSTYAILITDAPKLNRTCGHIPGLQPRSDERNGQVLDEIDSENAWGNCPIAWGIRQGPHKSTSAVLMRSRSNSNTFCGHIWRVDCESLRPFGPAVREIDSINAWGNCPMGHGPWGAKSTSPILIRFLPNFDTFEQHVWSLQPPSLSVFGRVFVESDSFTFLAIAAPTPKSRLDTLSNGAF
jgi:hypothetical protein